MKIYNVYYKDITFGNENEFECSTTNFNKWLKETNKERVKDGNEPYEEFEFHIQETELITFKNK